MADDLTLTVNGQIYSGWTEVRQSDGIDQLCGSFDISVSEAWAGVGASPPWQIKPFDAVTLAIGGEVVLSGFVDDYQPSFDADSHAVRIAGRSKTCDLADCMPDIKGGQFNGYTLDRIARAVAAPFGIEVVVNADMGDAIPDATMEKTETAFAFLERLCRLRSVLATDDPAGRLVLTTAGTAGTAGALVHGGPAGNIKAARGALSGKDRFSQYVAMAQSPLAYDNEAPALQVVGTATDAGVPRYRRHAEMSEGPADNSLAAARAKWRALHNLGEGTRADVTLQGWRQPDGTLWRKNMLVPMTSPWLEIDRTMLIGAVTRVLSSDGGRLTELTLAPPEAYQPEPAKLTKKKANSSASWQGLIQ